MKTDTKQLCVFLLGAEKGVVLQNFKDTKASYDSQIKRLIDATNDIIDATSLVAFDFDGTWKDRHPRVNKNHSHPG